MLTRCSQKLHALLCFPCYNLIKTPTSESESGTPYFASVEVDSPRSPDVQFQLNEFITGTEE